MKLVYRLSRLQWTWREVAPDTKIRFWTRWWRSLAHLMRAFSQSVARRVERFWEIVFAPFFRLMNWDSGRPWKRAYALIENGVGRVVDWGEAQGNLVLDMALQRRFTFYGAAQFKNEKRSAGLRRIWSTNCAWWLGMETCLFVLALVQRWPYLTAPWTRNGHWFVNAQWQSTGAAMVWTILGASWLLMALSASGLGNALDRDRANGNLIFLFLAPLTDADILLGKLLFPLLSMIAPLATTVPWLVVGTLAAFIGGDYLFPIIALLSFALLLSSIGAALCWQVSGAARATKPGSGASNAALAIALSAIGTIILLVLTGSYSQFALCMALLFAVGLHIVLLRLAWESALSAMHKQRYSDQTMRGTVAN